MYTPMLNNDSIVNDTFLGECIDVRRTSWGTGASAPLGGLGQTYLGAKANIWAKRYLRKIFLKKYWKNIWSENFVLKLSKFRVFCVNSRRDGLFHSNSVCHCFWTRLYFLGRGRCPRSERKPVSLWVIRHHVYQ